MAYPDHLKPLVDAIEAADVAPPPAPWVRTGCFTVGGLRAVGFSSDSKYLLIYSVSGRGVFNCQTGDKLDRDFEEFGDWLNQYELTAQGIGLISDEQIRLSGIYGGGLALTTPDGWRLQSYQVDWPDENVVLTKRPHSMYDLVHCKEVEFTCVARESELRAYRFSPSGKCLVIATSSDLDIYHLSPS